MKTQLILSIITLLFAFSLSAQNTTYKTSEFLLRYIEIYEVEETISYTVRYYIPSTKEESDYRMVFDKTKTKGK